MALEDLDRSRRMIDYLKPEQLETRACVDLASEILAGMAHELSRAAKAYARHPNKETEANLRMCRNVFASDYFAALSSGVVDGEQAARTIIKDALRGVRLNDPDDDDEEM